MPAGRRSGSASDGGTPAHTVRRRSASRERSRARAEAPRVTRPPKDQAARYVSCQWRGTNAAGRRVRRNGERAPACAGEARTSEDDERETQSRKAHRTQRCGRARRGGRARALRRQRRSGRACRPQGLYDPALDKDSCGVGFIADIKGRKSHQLVEDALAILCNLEHRGAVGADPRAGDGAGILVQIPHKFFAKKADRLGFTLPSPGEYAIGVLFMPRDPDWRQVIRDIYAQMIKREGMTLARLARRADRQLDARRIGQADRAGAPAGVHRPRQEDQERGRVRAPALHPAQVDLERDLHPPGAPAVRLLPGVDLLPHRRLQGHVPRRPARHLLSRPARPGLRERARARAPALLHQHLPDLVARASLPDDRPQRRDQHAARQQQLDGGAAGLGVVGAVRRRHQQALADLLRGPVRHRLLRQRARIPGAGRLPARARDDDDDPGGLGGQSAHGRGAARLLRVQRRADGAVGRPGGDRLHQRPPDRRHARPQRPAPGALFRHPRRPHHHGVRDGRAADPRKGHRHQVAPAAGQDAAGRSRRGPPHSRRGAQGDARQEPSLQGLARAHPDRARGPAGRAGRGARSPTWRCSIASRRSATRRRTCAS